MSTAPTLVADLAAVTGVAAITGLIARQLKQPLVVGYLVAGLFVGPYLPFPVFADPDRVHGLAELGVVLVMFVIGLEFRVRRLLEVLPVSGFTGVVQVGVLLWVGFSLGQLFGWSAEASTFLAAALAISSTMVVTGVFEDVEIAAATRTHVLGVLVFQDVVAIVLIAALTALAAGQSLEAGQMALTIAQLGVVLVGLLVVGILVVPPIVRRVTANSGPATLAVVAMGLAFGFASLAQALGYSAALGAFVGGMVVAESGRSEPVEHVVAPIKDVFAAVFFVSVGMAVDPREAIVHLPTSLVVAGSVIVAQLASVSLAGLLSGVPLRRAMVAGLALGQIGEFSFILAAIGVAAGVAPPELTPILVTVAALTAFTTPRMLAMGDWLVSFVARSLPHRVQSSLSLVEVWVDRLRTRSQEDHPFRGPVRAAGTDLLLLFGLLVTAASSQRAVRGVLEDSIGLNGAVATLLLSAALTLALVPLASGLFRSLGALSMAVDATVLPNTDRSRPAGRAALGMVHALFWAAVFLGLIAPALSLLRPLLPGGVVETVWLAGLIGLTVMLWRRMGTADGELRSGTAFMAQALERHLAEGSPEKAALPAEARMRMGGLADVVQVRVGEAGADRSLAELDVRARTGATVVAVTRGTDEVIMPTAHEPLLVGDLLGLVGSDEAVRLAAALVGDEAAA